MKPEVRRASENASLLGDNCFSMGASSRVIGGREIELEARLLPREREILLAGGMLKYLRAGGQERIGIVEGDSASAGSGDSESGVRS